MVHYFDIHMVRLEQLLRQTGFKLKPSKCELFYIRTGYLGYIVSVGGKEINNANTTKTGMSLMNVHGAEGNCQPASIKVDQQALVKEQKEGPHAVANLYKAVADDSGYAGNPRLSQESDSVPFHSTCSHCLGI